MFRRALNRLMAACALAIEPITGVASPEPAARIATDRVEDAILDADNYAAHRAEFHARYTGPITSMAEQVAVMGSRRLSNGCLAARVEYDRFVEDRTR